MDTGRLRGRYEIRPPRLSDATALADAYRRNRGHLAPYEPRRIAEFYTEPFQRDSLANALKARAHGRSGAWLILDGDRVIGRLNLNNVVHGVLRSADLGYWVDREFTGRGIATSAVEFGCAAALDLGLHRVEAGTLVANRASQAVLRKCGFEAIGHAPSFLFIDGVWRDHDLFQRILHDDPPG